MPAIGLWGVRIIAGATGYALNDVKNFFTSGDEKIGTATSYTLLLFVGVALSLLAYIFITKR